MIRVKHLTKEYVHALTSRDPNWAEPPPMMSDHEFAAFIRKADSMRILEVLEEHARTVPADKAKFFDFGFQKKH